MSFDGKIGRLTTEARRNREEVRFEISDLRRQEERGRTGERGRSQKEEGGPVGGEEVRKVGKV